jgi:hypothetical protein
MVTEANNPDLHGNVPDDCSVVLILIDLINDFEFAGADEIFTKDESDNRYALEQMAKVLKADTRASVEIDFSNLKEST